MTLTIRQAGPDQFDTVFGLLADGVRWLRSKGLDQWSTWENWREKMRPSLERGDVWLLYEGNDLIGTVTVETLGDSDFWTPRELAESAGYVSKLAIRRDRQGGELGRLLLEWASDHAYRFGCDWLRLDAWKNNDRLHAYYADRGWTYLRTMDKQGRHSGTLFQIRTGPLDHAAHRRLKEIPEIPAVRSLVRTPDESADAAGNWRPSHIHYCDEFTIEYPWLNPTSLLVIPGYRYMLRHTAEGWMLFSSMPGSAWKESGRMITTSLALDRYAEYVLTHDERAPCSVRMAEVRRGASLSVSPLSPVSPDGS